MLSDEAINAAKKRTIYSLPSPFHDHNDCIRIAYEWLDAQKKLKNISSKAFGIKHIIENWAGRYVSTSDVEVAAHLHPEIHGTYSRFNISMRLTEPSTERLKTTPEAFKHPNYRDHYDSSVYKIHEKES